MGRHYPNSLSLLASFCLIVLAASGSEAKSSMQQTTCETLPSTVHITKGNAMKIQLKSNHPLGFLYARGIHGSRNPVTILWGWCRSGQMWRFLFLARSTISGPSFRILEGEKKNPSSLEIRPFRNDMNHLQEYHKIAVTSNVSKDCLILGEIFFLFFF